jgi:DNA-binding CsgD family transcriptional regulator
MNTILLSGFTRSECAMHAGVFRMLFPGSSFEEYASDGDAPESGYKAAVVNCSRSGWQALEMVQQCHARDVPVVLYTEYLPDALFVQMEKDAGTCSLLFCPESTAELSECGEAVAQGKRYVSRAALRTDPSKKLNRLFDYRNMRETGRYILYGIMQGKSIKETAALAGTDAHTITVTLSRIRSRYACASSDELLKAALSWLNYRQETEV